MAEAKKPIWEALNITEAQWEQSLREAEEVSDEDLEAGSEFFDKMLANQQIRQS